MIYIDTNIFIYAVEGVAATVEPSKKLLEALRTHRGMGVTSEITLAEVLAPPQRKDALPFPIQKRLYLNLILWSRAFNLVPVSRDILIDTARIRIETPLKLPDAVHLITAVRSNCRYFVCHDNDFRRLPDRVKRVGPTMREVNALLAEIS